MRFRGWIGIVAVLLTGALSIAGVAPASAAPVVEREPSAASEIPDANERTLLGNDISWPQCGRVLPGNHAFGIVGVNGGLANNTNPCFASQFAWASRATGGTGQPRVALYVNTANPGHAGSWWPTSNAYGGRMVYNPYGTCTGAENRPCAYMYGYAKAYDNVKTRGVPNPGAYLWWLDVELINTWSYDRVSNAAALEGMTAYLRGIGARVGLYSTHYQWNRIVGQVGITSNLRGLPSWLAGANGVPGAKGMCAWPSLTPGGTVTMTQFVSNDLDYNYSCI